MGRLTEADVRRIVREEIEAGRRPELSLSEESTRLLDRLLNNQGERDKPTLQRHHRADEVIDRADKAADLAAAVFLEGFRHPLNQDGADGQFVGDVNGAHGRSGRNVVDHDSSPSAGDAGEPIVTHPAARHSAFENPTP